MGEPGGGDMPMWKGLFEWSMKFQDSTTGTQARQLSKEDRDWLEDALKNAMVDLSKRMSDIKEALDTSVNDDSGTSNCLIDDKEKMLEELLDLVESIDQAKDLSTIGGLSTLLGVIQGGCPSLQWRAAEIIGTCAQNNPQVQLSFLQGGAMSPLMELLDSEDKLCRLKGLFAISCMIRGCPQAHDWFTERHGVIKMIKMVDNSENNARIVRKCLQIMDYAYKNSKKDQDELLQHAEYLVSVLTRIVNEEEDQDVRIMTLELCKSMGNTVVGLGKLKECPELHQAIRMNICKLDAVPKDDWGTAEDEARAAREVSNLLSQELPDQDYSTTTSTALILSS